MILGVSDMILTLCIFSTHTPVTRRERPNLFWLFFQVQTAKYISETETATDSRMPHMCQTNHSHKERPKHKILALIFSQENLCTRFLLVLYEISIRAGTTFNVLGQGQKQDGF